MCVFGDDVVHRFYKAGVSSLVVRQDAVPNALPDLPHNK